MLVDIPPATWLEVVIQKTDVLFWLRDAAETLDCNDAVDASRDNGSLILQVLDTIWQNFVCSDKSRLIDTSLQGRGRDGIRLDAVDLARGRLLRSRPRLVDGVGQNLRPHPTAGSNLQDDTAERRALGSLVNLAILDPTLEERDHPALGPGLGPGTHEDPKVAEPGVVECLPGEQGAQVTRDDELGDGCEEVECRGGHDGPWLQYRANHDVSGSAGILTC